MPNWCENVLVIKGPTKLINKLLSERFSVDVPDVLSLDFQKIIPMPKSLDIEDNTYGFRGFELFITDNQFDASIIMTLCNRNINTSGYILDEETYNKIKLNLGKDLKKAYRLGKQYYNNIKKYGYQTWYGWRTDNWGTKWDACDCNVNTDIGDKYSEVTVWFNTAWSPCKPIIFKLIKLYPDLEFDYAYYESGCFFGGTISKDSEGVYVHTYVDNSALLDFALEHYFIGEEEYNYIKNGGDNDE